MTHRSDSTALARVVELLTEHSMEEVAGAVTLLRNEAVRADPLVKSCYSGDSFGKVEESTG
ncbi:MAG: hypothetical protein AB7O52_19415 [Planctomycetota bacterium]